MTEPTMGEREVRGKIHPKKTLFFRQNVGSAEADGRSYEMSMNVGGSHPIIQSRQTEKWFTLSWQEIIDMAIEAGIDYD